MCHRAYRISVLGAMTVGPTSRHSMYRITADTLRDFKSDARSSKVVCRDTLKCDTVDADSITTKAMRS